MPTEQWKIDVAMMAWLEERWPQSFTTEQIADGIGLVVTGYVKRKLSLHKVRLSLKRCHLRVVGSEGQWRAARKVGRPTQPWGEPD